MCDNYCIEINKHCTLFRMGPKGRKALVDSWAQYLPLYTQTETINQQAVTSPGQNHVNSNNTHAPNSEAMVST